MSRSVKQQIEAARRRLEAAQKKSREADRVIPLEKFRIYFLESLQAAGPGHAWTEAKLPEDAFDTGGLPSCRHCRNILTSDPSREPCTGDQNRCPELIPAPGDWEGVVAQWKDPDGWVRCRRSGRFNEGFTVWRCAAGHVVSEEGGHRRADCGGSWCPHKYMVYPKVEAFRREIRKYEEGLA